MWAMKCYGESENVCLEKSFKVIYAADRHAKKELKKQVRGVRAIERSSVQLASAIATKLRTFEACDLAMVSPHAWLDICAQLRQQKLNRVEQFRFRRSPQKFLASLENPLFQLTLPL